MKFRKARERFCEHYPRTSVALYLSLYPLVCLLCPIICLLCPIAFCCRDRRFAWDEDDSDRWDAEKYWTTECRRRQDAFGRSNFLSLGSTSRKYKHQKKSRFFQCLPLEVRRMIYAYVLNDETYIHLAVSGKRFVIPGCADQKCPANPCQFHLEEEHDSAVTGHARCVFRYEPSFRYKNPRKHYQVERLRTSPLHFLPLLRTCQRV
jgi:hypothetical protein